MKTDGQDFLERLAGFPPDTFESGFCAASKRLGLEGFSRNELTLLYEAALRADLCCQGLNGLDRPAGKIRPEEEPTRRRLEWDFLAARDALYASPGWQEMARARQEAVERALLTVEVAEQNLG